MRYTFLAVCHSGEISTYQIDIRKQLGFEPSGAFFQALQQARIIFSCYPGTDRIELFHLVNWDGSAPPKYLVTNWLRFYRYGHRQELENRVYKHWTFKKGSSTDAKKTTD